MKSLLIPLLSTLSLLSAQKPNVIVIFADDLGYGDLGCYGATKVKTPNIDRLAADGRRFTDAHSASAVCTPSRYALVTGEYPMRGTLSKNGNGHWGPCHPNSELLVETDKTTVADVFKTQGYATACIGKWHLGFGTDRDVSKWNNGLTPGPNDLGFDYYFGMPVVNSAPPYLYVENTQIVGAQSDDPLYSVGKGETTNQPMPPLPPEAGQRGGNRYSGASKAHELFVEEEVGATFAKKAVEWIEEQKETPFFLYLATTHIHHPFTPAQQFKGTSEIGLYGDFIHELDWMVGELTATLDQHGLTDNTLIIFTSDNGGMFNRGGQDAWKAGHAQNGNCLLYTSPSPRDA